FEDEIDKTELIKNIFLFSTDVVLQTYSQGKISTGGILNVFKRSKKTNPFTEWSSKDANTVIERVTKIEAFKNKIKERAEKSPNGKTIIFIDDLDRIPEKIVDFLNSLKTFLDINGCIFVLGCDYKILDSALKQKYKGAIYDDYFDKIVQTEFYIPKISEQAIKKYLQFLTGWNVKEIEECTQLVIHSIGGNPRKIKRVVNATMLIKSVLEKRLATFLQAFERPEPRVSIERGVEGKKEASEEPKDLKREITKIFTPAEVFNLLFDKKVLFKLVCMREQWFTYYENILSEEKKQDVLISLQDLDFTTDMSKLLGTAKEIVISELLSVTKEQGDIFKKHVENFPIFLNDYPRFQGVEDLKTYLTLLEISSPEAGISLEYAEPEKLPINLFNRYMLFERINKGKVEERIIREKIKQEDWKGNLSSYHFFSEVISAFRYDNLLRDLFRKVPIPFIPERITDSDPKAIAWLLDSVRGVEKETARTLLNQTKHTYAEKIRSCTDPWAISGLLESVRDVEEETARALLNQTKDTYADKIRDSSDLEAIGWLLTIMSWIEEETARELISETKDTYVRKIRDSVDAGAIGRLLSSVRWIEEETARGLISETKDTYVRKIRDSADAGAIGILLGCVWEIDDATASDDNTAGELLRETKDTYADKIRASTDPGAIGVLLHNVGLIDERTAGELLRETKDIYAAKIIASTDPNAIRGLLDSVNEIDKETTRGILNQTKDTYIEKIRDSANTFAIGRLLRSVSEIDKETGRGLLNQTKDTYIEKIRDSTDLVAIGLLLDSVRKIDPETAEWLEKETKFETEEN
ncbi:KAP family P-loop domain-containing protein, partial [Candidatus Methanophagaceae archaeon]